LTVIRAARILRPRQAAPTPATLRQANPAASERYR
jgi:hypothetical protein